MSYLNINYSSLEDAWGSNFEKSKKKKHPDVCNVYNKRNSTKTLRPYKSFQESSHIKPIYEDDNYTKYYGYKDGRPFSRKSNKLSKYNLKFPYKRASISNHYISDEEDVGEEYINEEEENIYEESFEPIKPIIQSKNTFKRASPKQPTLIRTNFSYIDEERNDNLTYKRPIVIEEENDNEDYIQEEVSSNLRKRVSPTFKQRARKHIPLTQPEVEDEDYFTNIHTNYESEEEFDTYLSTKKKQPVYHEDDDDEYNKIIQSVYEEHTQKKRYKHIADEELEEEDLDENFKIKTSKKKMKERVFLDLMLYTISGIILIFIMEQFIQIGMKIKTTI